MSGEAAVTTIVYDVMNGDSTAPNLVTGSQAATWGEVDDLPVAGTAIFRPNHQPATTLSSAVASSDWPYATIDYLDVNGNQTNTATYGAGAWQVETNQYDSDGNVLWQLSAGNRAQALAPTVQTDPYVSSLSNLDAANLLRSTSVYNPLNSADVTDNYGPTHPMTLSTGTVIDGRVHTSTIYDEGAPNGDTNPNTGDTYDLPTTTITDAVNVQSGAETGLPDAHITHMGYGPVATDDPSDMGWALGQPTSKTTQMAAGPLGATLTTYTRFDSAGRTIEIRLPNDAAGTTSRTTKTMFYTATGTGQCVDPTQVGQVCSISPAAQPSAGSPLPTDVYSYNKYGDPISETQTYGSSGVQRVISYTYDAADRLTNSSTTVSPASAGGAALPSVSYSYDSATGLPTSTRSGDGSNSATLTTSYDQIGEPTSYTDATGNVSVATYDIAGRVSTLNDGKGSTTFTYDSPSEHRGLVTGEDIGVAGQLSSLSATYGPDGELASETYPNGLVGTTSYDNASDKVALTYAKSGTTWMKFADAIGMDGKIASSTSPISTQNYTYDQYDRLTSVQDTVGGACTTRQYSYDADSNRTSLDSYSADATGNCTTSSNPNATTWTYDEADRVINSGYSYDALGRTLTVPGADATGTGTNTALSGPLTIGYFANDMVATQSQGASSLSYTLDPDQDRILTRGDGSQTTTFHYVDDSDSPAWTGTGASTWTRMITGVDGNLAATAAADGTVTLELVNLHGDVVATAADVSSASQVTSYSETTEFGVPRVASSANAPYGWLGSKRRDDSNFGGLIIMGARLYNPNTGRFLTVDPVAGGNANAYIYPADPINTSDTSGDRIFTTDIYGNRILIGDRSIHHFVTEHGLSPHIVAAGIAISHHIQWQRGLRWRYRFRAIKTDCFLWWCDTETIWIRAVVQFDWQPWVVTAFCEGYTMCPAWVNTAL